MAKKATKYRMDTVKIRAELRKDPSKWTVDVDGFGELVGWKLPYYAGGEPLTEGECADLLGLSDRQVRNLAKKGLPRERVRRQWRYPSLDAMHWRCGYELERARQRGRSLNHLSLTRAREVVMDFTLEQFPDDCVKVPLRLARLAPAEIPGDEWPEYVVTTKKMVDSLIAELEPFALEFEEEKPKTKRAKRATR